MTEHYTDEGHLLIRNSDIKDGYFEFGENPIYLDEEFSEQNKSRMHQLGDVITVHTGDIGTSAVIGENEVNSIGFATIVTRPNQEVLDSNYFATYLNTNTHKQWAISMATGDGRSNYNLKDYTNLVIPIPQIEEQIKIAACISNLNNLITLHQRKSFSKNCKKIVWEQRKLEELAEIVGGGTPSTSVNSYWDGDIDWYAPAEIGEQIYLESSQRKITEEGLNKSSAKILPIGTVLFTSRAGIGKTAILLKEGCTNQGFQSIVPNKVKLDSYFIFTRSEELKRYGETVGAGSTFVEVSGKQMANMELMMPKTMPEQQQIGEYFANLDHLITLHRRAYHHKKRRTYK